MFVFGVEGKERGSKCIALFNLIHKKTVLNIEDASEFENFMAFIDIFYRMVNFLKLFFLEVSTLVVIATEQLHSTKPKLRLCAGSNYARGVSDILRMVQISDNGPG